MFALLHRLRAVALWGILVVALVNNLSAVQCGLCSKNITGKYLRIGPLVVHPNCFRCQQCDKNISKTYRQEGRTFFHPECYRQKQGLICAHCNKLLGQTWITSSGKHYHENCYTKFIQPKCSFCKRPIEEKFTEQDGHKYHLHCFRNNKLPKCSYCQVPLEGVHLKDAWGNLYHENHRGVKTPTCFSCNRVISKRTSNGGVRLNDGRALCSFCNKYAIVQPAQVLPLEKAARATLRKVGISNIPTGIDIKLVDRKELARLTNGLSYHIKGGMRGLTLSEETMVGKKRKNTSHTIYLLQHMATLELEGVLAHELIHVWLFENRIKLSSAETEGLCNLGNYLIYQKSPSPMAKHFLNTLNNDKDPIYGDGYRKMKQRLDKEGWAKLLASIRKRTRP